MYAVNFSVNSSATDSWTMNRFAEMQTSPMLRILAPLAPSTSASSKRMKGALPPNSIEVRSTCSEAWDSRWRPTGVDPVKESLRRRRSARILSATP